MNSKKPVILITGCSSGIGEALCRAFHSRKCRVIATARRFESLDGLRNEGIETYGMDVTKSIDIEHVVKSVLEDNGVIDVLVNNAGYALIGPSIDMSDAALRSQFETNLFAPMALIREVAPSMRERHQGKIVNIGSVSGVVSTPFSGAYCSSKAALHSISDALRTELAPFGIQVITVQPGAVKSHFGSTAAELAGESLPKHSWYQSLRQTIRERAELSQGDAMPAEDFAESLADSLLTKCPPPILRLGPKSRSLPFIRNVLPVKVLDNIFMKKFNLHTLQSAVIRDPYPGEV